MVGRWKIIFAGYVAADFVAGVLLMLLFFKTVQFFDPTSQYGIADFLYVGALMSFWALVVTAIPFAVFVYLAERFSWRHLFAYAAVGALMPLPIALSFEPEILIQCMGIGAIAGLTYWWVAGRSAGLRKTVQA